MSAYKDRLAALNVIPFGVNPAGIQSHQAYLDKKDYQLDIISDVDRNLAAAYEALKENGKSIERTVYLIGTRGEIVFAKQGMPSMEEIIAPLT